MKFEIFSRKVGLIKKTKQFFFRMRSSNGKIVLQSEGYHNREDCVDTVKLIRRTAGRSTIVFEE